MFLKLTKQMEAAGMDKTADQCNRKINKLKYEYKNIKDINARSGSGRKEWAMWQDTDQQHRPPVIVESGSPSVSPEEVIHLTRDVAEDSQGGACIECCGSKTGP